MVTLPQIQAAVAQVVGRCYPLAAPDQPELPYAVYTRVATTPEATQADGVPIENWRIQIDVYGLIYADVITLAGQVRTALVADPFLAVPLSSADMYEDQVRLYRITQDFSFWVPSSDGLESPAREGYIYSPAIGRFIKE